MLVQCKKSKLAVTFHAMFSVIKVQRFFIRDVRLLIPIVASAEGQATQIANAKCLISFRATKISRLLSLLFTLIDAIKVISKTALKA